MSTMKICKRCSTEKILEQFSKHKKCLNGYQGTCIECTAKTTAEWTQNNKARKAQTDRQFEQRNPNRKKEFRELKKLENPYLTSISECEQNMRVRYGVTLEYYGHMFNDQNGKCKICKRFYTEFARGLVIDHNHETGQVRGLLCDPCNRALGYFRESSVIMESAIEYINQAPIV